MITDYYRETDEYDKAWQIPELLQQNRNRDFNSSTNQHAHKSKPNKKLGSSLVQVFRFSKNKPNNKNSSQKDNKKNKNLFCNFFFIVKSPFIKIIESA